MTAGSAACFSLLDRLAAPLFLSSSELGFKQEAKTKCLGGLEMQFSGALKSVLGDLGITHWMKS